MCGGDLFQTEMDRCKRKIRGWVQGVYYFFNQSKVCSVEHELGAEEQMVAGEARRGQTPKSSDFWSKNGHAVDKF